MLTSTYRSRSRRELTFASDSDPFDSQEVEKYIIGEFGARACVFERVCAHYATRARSQPRPQMDWSDVFRQYKRSPDQAKELYLLSVFLGDIVGSPQLCHQLGKRRGCDDTLLANI
ncbi:jg10800 [Pararge aegeria aegeria]|uniref:Jg10800 protein n=1 Tax=Pararge aegeria aegeria TaxID=348720 RepID=A0A8S4R9D7_9NEOP|nr:jg10800 [Pararge aegeria aegeria]